MQNTTTYTKPNQHAVQHVRDAEKLTRELGGSDTDVKEWFFNLPPQELIPIFDKYKEEYGQNRYNYAVVTFNRWKDGEIKMSGTVAERLFSIIPEFMPLETKYELVKSLWQHVSPPSKRLVEAPAEADINEIVQAVTEEIMMLATTWKIPAELNARFHWLTKNDVIEYQALLSHVRDTERKLTAEILKQQVPLLRREFLESKRDITSTFNYVVEIDKLSVELRVLSNIDKITAKEWHMPQSFLPQNYMPDNQTNDWVRTVMTGLLVMFFTVVLAKILK